MEKNKTYKPTTAKDRIVVLDALRGFALVGIIFANILSWSGIKFLPIEEIKSFGDFNTDVTLYKYLHFFVDTKFYTIFSLLFGIGFSLQFKKADIIPGFIPMYIRRLTILLFIGAVHAVFWSGDILVLYALMGFVLITLRNLSLRQTLTLAIILLLIPIITDIIAMYTIAGDIQVLPKVALKVYPDMTPNEVVAGFQSGDFLTTLKTNWHNLYWRYYDFIPSGRPFKVLSLFLLGFYLFKSNWFIEKAPKFKTFILFAIIGLSFTQLSIYMNGSITKFSKDWYNVSFKLIHDIGQTTLAISYVSLLSILVNQFPKFILWDLLKNYGRMSMTSYIGHTVLGIIVFYPMIGWGYFGTLSLTNVFEIAALLLVIQVAFSTIWFKFFAFGPIEWAWKCLTYKKIFPLRIKK